MERATAEVLVRSFTVEAGGKPLVGDLILPRSARGLVVYAHGSGSSRLSPRNRFVADVLVDGKMGAVLVDLLTVGEEHDRSNVFDIELLARRLLDITLWIHGRSETGHLPLGYFGASTGAGAALVAAAQSGVPIAAIVSRGGRPDLAGKWLTRVISPTLLLVGGNDPVVLDLNREALARLAGEKHLEVIPGASHLFEERGTLEAVAAHAVGWFGRFLGGTG
jgi:putative phosphoribosyl transferase